MGWEARPCVICSKLFVRRVPSEKTCSMSCSETLRRMTKDRIQKKANANRSKRYPQAS